MHDVSVYKAELLRCQSCFLITEGMDHHTGLGGGGEGKCTLFVGISADILSIGDASEDKRHRDVFQWGMGDKQPILP